MNGSRALILSLAAIFLFPSFLQAVVIQGTIFDENSLAIAGATIRASREGEFISGTSTNSLGRYSLKIPASIGDSLRLAASSLGFIEKAISVKIQQDTTTVDFQLLNRPLDIGTVVVRPDSAGRQPGVTLDKRMIEQSARYSLIPSNPIEAIKLPQALREGSNLSSKLIIDGTSPRYYINGLDIGSNPNHFGIFSIFPAAIVGQIDFNAQGSSARFGAPAIISLRTPTPFARHLTGELNPSFVECNGFVSYGTDNYFVLASVRKSILDEISGYINYRPDRLQLPPADFRDFFFSSGIKLSDRQRLFIDHYYVQDNLKYQTGPTSRNPYGVDSSQKTRESLTGIRFESVDKNLQFKAAGASKIGDELYRASPNMPLAQNSAGYSVYLHAERQINLGDFEMTILRENSRFTIGEHFDHVTRRSIRLNQRSWNFRPPDDISDNPYIYQEAFDRYYGAYASNQAEFTNAGYISYNRLFERCELEAGLRTEYFGSLAEKWKIAIRSTTTFPAFGGGSIKVSCGSYAENPASNLMEPYQVLIDRYLLQLRPIQTSMLAVDISKGAFDIGIFAKDIRRIPHLTPDFAYADFDSATDIRFLKIESAGRLRFAGARLTCRVDRIISDRLKLLAFYGFNEATKFAGNLKLPYELAARHRFYANAEIAISRTANIGAELAVHSGFHYTPSYPDSLFQIEGRYSRQFYDMINGLENSRSFRTNVILNVHAGLNYDRMSIFCSVANITNYANPIINTADGFVYDAGILPSIGLSLKF